MTLVRRSTRLAFVVSLLALAGPASAQGVDLHAWAGLSGYVRPGRWVAVRIDVSSASQPISGDLVVQWGPAEVRWPVAVAPRIRRELEVYIRSADPRDVITVRLVSNDATMAETQAPVQILSNDSTAPRLIVCGASPHPSPPGCVARLDGTSIPHSWRGFDAADDVILSDAEIASLTDAQRQAIALHSAQAPLLNSGLGTPTLGPLPSERRWTSRSSTMLVGYASLFVALTTFVQIRRRGGMLAAIAASAALGSVAILAAGRVGPWASITIHHASSVDQYEGADASIVTLRGVAEFPARDAYTIRADVEDGAIADSNDRGAAIHLDESGFSTLSGIFGLGQSAAFTFEGAVTPALLRIARTGDGVHVRNVSSLILNQCGFSAEPAAGRRELLPGQEVSGGIADDDIDPTFSCSLDTSPWGFSEPNHPVVMNGRTAVVVHMKASAHAAAESDN